MKINCIKVSKKQELTNLGKHPHSKNKDLIINFDMLPADDLTKKLIFNLVECNILTLTRNQQL